MRDAGVARDYYGLLGVHTDARPDEIKRAYRRLARELHPDVNPDPAAQQRFKEVTAAYEVLSDPAKRQVVDLGRRPAGQRRWRSGRAAGTRSAPSASATSWTPSSAAAVARRRGPRAAQPRAPGDDALIRSRARPWRSAPPASATDLAVDTAALCSDCSGGGHRRPAPPPPCDICKGRGEVQQVQRSLLGQVVTSRPCPVVPRLRRGHPGAVPAVQRRGPGPRPARRPGQHPGRGRRRHPGAAGRVRARSAPAAAPPATCTSRSRSCRTSVFTRDGIDLHCTVHVPMTAAALGPPMALPTLSGPRSWTSSRAPSPAP